MGVSGDKTMDPFLFGFRYFQLWNLSVTKKIEVVGIMHMKQLIWIVNENIC